MREVLKHVPVLTSACKVCVYRMRVCVFQCDCSRVYMYRVDFKGLYKCVTGVSIQGFVCDVNIQGGCV